MLVAERLARARRHVSKKPARPVKLRDLLTHTCGVAAYPQGVDDVYPKRNRTLAETAPGRRAAAARVRAGHASGRTRNAGIDTLGRVIEVVAGETYEAFLQKRIFDPLGMTDTAFYPTAEQRDAAGPDLRQEGRQARSPSRTPTCSACPKARSTRSRPAGCISHRRPTWRSSTG